jgi:hypothetical protein
MEPSTKKRKLAPKITNPNSSSPSAISNPPVATASHSAEPQQYPVQDAAAAAAAAALASNPERHDFESFARHLQDAAMLIQRQAEHADPSTHGKVSVLLMRWADDPTAAADMDALEHTFQSRYNYRTSRWLIPSDVNPTLKVIQHLAAFLDNAPRDHLLVIYYGGYGFVRGDDELCWAR